MVFNIRIYHFPSYIPVIKYMNADISSIFSNNNGEITYSFNGGLTSLTL
jgi:hypothetical protein